MPGQSNDAQPFRRLRRETGDVAVRLRGEAFQKRIGQRHDVLAPLAQRRQMHGNRADAVKQILAQLAVLDGVLRLAVGGGDDAAIGLVTRPSADGPDFLFLQHAQQLALRVDRHFGNFIQEQRAAFRLAEQTFAVGVRAGERAFDRAEQFALDQFARQRGAIDFDERPGGARARRRESNPR